MSDCSHATYLFKIPQCWNVPSYMIDNTQYATIIGRRSTGSVRTDRIIQNELIPCTAFLSEYAVVFSEGHRMGPYDVSTGVKAFYHLTGHLIDWAEYLSRTRMIERNIPIEGLRQFHKLAAGVHKVAQAEGYEKKLEVRRSLWTAMRGKQRKHPRIIGGYNTGMIEEIEDVYRRRRSMGMLEEMGGREFEKRRF